MEDSVLLSMKNILGISNEMVVFDEALVSHINSAFSAASQLGVGPVDGFFITDDQALWSALDLPANQLALLRTYVQLKVKMLFDPPTTGFLIDATTAQLREVEWRLSEMREATIPLPVEEGEEVT